MRMNLLAAVIGMLCVVGCNGGSGLDMGGGGVTPAAANVQPVTVDSGPSAVAKSNSPAVNTLYTSVTICTPATSTCQTIDHIQVDTGSSGLRIIASELQLRLPTQTDLTGKDIAECTQFVDGSSWGPLHLADIKISGEVASNQPIQVIGETTYAVPGGCSGTVETTVADFGANGILGVGPFIQDCGDSCNSIGQNVYYTCVSTNNPQCAITPVKPALQVTNPVVFFATDNNGVIIQLNAVSSTAASVTGTMTFGIGTQSNNGLGNARVFTLDPNTGYLNTTYNNAPLTQSFIDSGSNAYYFPDGTIAICGANGASTSAKGFYCPGSTLNLSATMGGLNGIDSTVNFSVTNADSLFSGSATIAAAATLAAPSTTVGANNPQYDGTQTFDWGLPFYYGRTIYTAIEGRNTSAGAGPYFAF